MRSWNSSTSSTRAEALDSQAEGRIAEQTLDGAGDLLVEVDDALIGELSPVLTGDAVEIGDVRKLVLDDLTARRARAELVRGR